MNDNGMATTAHTMGNIHRAIIHSHAKDSGFNKSEALRDIIEDWARRVDAHDYALAACNMVFDYDEKIHEDVRAAIRVAIAAAAK